LLTRFIFRCGLSWERVWIRRSFSLLSWVLRGTDRLGSRCSSFLYVSDPTREVEFHPYSEFTVLTTPSLQITDGTPAGEASDHIFKVVTSASNELRNSRYGSDAVSFMFAQVGNDQKAKAFLGTLDTSPQVGNREFPLLPLLLLFLPIDLTRPTFPLLRACSVVDV